jgi:hypothetical protein
MNLQGKRKYGLIQTSTGIDLVNFCDKQRISQKISKSTLVLSENDEKTNRNASAAENRRTSQ